MDKIFIFSGTSEGRELSEYLAGLGIPHYVFVATEYGRIVMKDNPCARIMQGRLDYGELTELFQREQPDRVLDATHPYAREVSDNIRRAMETSGLEDRYIRISRFLPYINDGEEHSGSKITQVSSTEEAIEYLKGIPGNILLTTGVKTLNAYMACPELRDRIVARILPSVESLNLALDTGIAPKRIVAMEGPFGEEVNRSLIHQYDIEVMVSKNSGSNGGLNEKLTACEQCGIRLLLIDPGDREEGISLSEAKALFGGTEPAKSFCIAGIGPGSEKNLTLEACECIKKAGLIIGAERMVSLGRRINPMAACYVSFNPADIREYVLHSEYRDIVYLVSGDSGFYSGAKKVGALLSDKVNIKIIPGISSISYLAAAIKEPYSETAITSFHGKDIDYDYLQKRENFYALTSGRENVSELASRVLSMDSRARVYIGYNLGYEDEDIYMITAWPDKRTMREGLYVIGVFFSE